MKLNFYVICFPYNLALKLLVLRINTKINFSKIL